MTNDRQNIFSGGEPPKPSEEDIARGKEKYLRDTGKIEDFPEVDEMGGIMKEQVVPAKPEIKIQEEPMEDGHNNEWQDRARVEDADEMTLPSSPRQSNVPEEDLKDKNTEDKEGNRYY
ncbi:MAG: hypothetical protein ABI687_07090 [Flavitalea sp.]